MLHACFVHFPTCFMCTFIHFLAFLGTNLLTRCRSASSCFLLFLVSEKVYRKYFRNGTGQKPKFLICRRNMESEGEPKGGPRVARHALGVGPPLATPRHCLGSPGRICPFAHIISVSGKP